MGKFSDYLDSMKTQTDTLREVVTEKSGVDCSELSIKGVADVVKDIQTGKDPILQDKTVNPQTYAQKVTADDGFDGLREVNFNAVDSSIDENITPNNIKQGVTILGVAGNLATDKPDQTKTTIPTKERQIVRADTGYELAENIVEPIPDEYEIPVVYDGSLQVTPTKENQTLETAGKKLSGNVVVNSIPNEYADVSNVDATAEDVLNGKTFVDNQGNEIQGTAELKENLAEELTSQDEKIERLTVAIDTLEETGSGGGGSNIGTGDYYLKVIDYDGTVLAEKRLNNGDTFKLPKSPTHKGLVFQEWSCSQEIVDGLITIADNNVMVGATYTTESGLSEFDITLTKVTGLAVTLNMDGTKNWGDGTSDDLTTHTYTDYGDYTITCNGTTSNGYLFGQNQSAKNYYCTSIRFGVGITSVGSRLSHCSNLTSIVIPNSVTGIDGSAFYYCERLKSIVMPSGVTSIGGNAFYNCSRLTSIVMPSGVTSINSNNVFYSCSRLTSIVIPNSVTSIGNGSFYYCSRLTSIVMPSGVTSIARDNFNSCASIIKYDFTQHTTIPTLANTGAFDGINPICKIYVPDALYDEWIVATNWSTYADYIYKASEMEVSNG